MNASRQPFSARVGLTEAVDESLYEGVPPHLLGPLRGWLVGVFQEQRRYGSDTAAEHICVQLRFELPRRAPYDEWLCNRQGPDLLNVVDEALAYGGTPSAPPLVDNDQRRALARLLNVAGSAYQLADDRTGLETKVAPEVRESVRQTVADAEAASGVGSAAEHLALSWRAAYGVNPDPVRAYSEAIKAVECAAHDVMQSNHAGATLGSMLGELNNVRHKLTTAIPAKSGGDPTLVVEQMMRTLWEGQSSRHGSKSVTVPETLEAARAAVHLAAVLVQWFVSGAVARQP